MKNLIKKIFDYINKIGKIRTDLLLHCGVSTVIFVLLFNILCLFMNAAEASGISVLITFMIGLGKEYIIDKIMRDSYFDKEDLYADMVGIIIGYVAIIPALFKTLF